MGEGDSTSILDAVKYIHFKILILGLDELELGLSKKITWSEEVRNGYIFIVLN